MAAQGNALGKHPSKKHSPERAKQSSAGPREVWENILNIDVQDSQDYSTPAVPGPVHFRHVLQSLALVFLCPILNTGCPKSC
jgi:hypothetical protein